MGSILGLSLVLQQNREKENREKPQAPVQALSIHQPGNVGRDKL